MKGLNKNLKIGLVAVLAVFVFTGAFAVPAFAQSTSAQTAISSAQESLKNCYLALKDAESAGANVNPLMVTLNDASELLTKAQLAYASNDGGAAYNYASQSKSELSDFVAQATALKQSALASDTQDAVFTVLLLAVAVGIACAGVVAVVVMNRRESDYRKDISRVRNRGVVAVVVMNRRERKLPQ